MTHRVPRSGVTPWLWAGLSVAAWVTSFFAAFGVLIGAGSVGIRVPEVAGLRTELAVLLAMFGAFGAAGVVVASRVAFGRWPAAGVKHAIVPLIGLALAVAVELGLHEWAQARWSHYDSDMIGATAGLSFTLITLAVATFAAAIAPRGSALPPLMAQVIAAAVVGLIVILNVEGITDGIEPASRLLAILVGLSATYAVAAVVIGARRALLG